MKTSAILVLVVDDFEQWRQFVCTALKQIPDVTVQQASDGLEADGLEAIEKAQRFDQI